MAVKWGIIGTGNIAKVFTEDLLSLTGHTVVAVGSRSRDRSERFAATYGIARAYSSYQELADDDDVDVGYIATPHSSHYDDARICLEAGRAVLVEKPLCATEAEARSLTDLARGSGLFAMEAMWTRFNPLIARVREIVEAEMIGPVRFVQADFSDPTDYDPQSRLWNPGLAGGAVLDVGVYPVSLAAMILGDPLEVKATGTVAPSGIEAEAGILTRYSSGAVATMYCGFLARSRQAAVIAGERGTIEIHPPFYNPTELTVTRIGHDPVTQRRTPVGHGYTHQAEEVARCLARGLTESPVMTLDSSADVLRTLDAVRAAVLGVSSPGGARSWPSARPS
jgi:predicted dehydrogenase